MKRAICALALCTGCQFKACVPVDEVPTEDASVIDAGLDPEDAGQAEPDADGLLLSE